MNINNSQDLAVLFHDTYERLAPDYGYETRSETKTFDPKTPNGRLMIAVCASILNQLIDLVEKELYGAIDFHLRAWKLMQKRKHFIVIAEDESYYMAAYTMIRTSEIAKGTWTANDEQLYNYTFSKALSPVLHTKDE